MPPSAHPHEYLSLPLSLLTTIIISWRLSKSMHILISSQQFENSRATLCFSEVQCYPWLEEKIDLLGHQIYPFLILKILAYDGAPLNPIYPSWWSAVKFVNKFSNHILTDSKTQQIWKQKWRLWWERKREVKANLKSISSVHFLFENLFSLSTFHGLNSNKYPMRKQTFGHCKVLHWTKSLYRMFRRENSFYKVVVKHYLTKDFNPNMKCSNQLLIFQTE